MKGSEEFVYFLVGGLVILAVLLVIFNYYHVGCTTCNGPKQPELVEAVKTFSIPSFSASNLLDNRSTQPVSKNVYSGLLFGSDRITYNLTKSSLQDVVIRFRVDSANEMGPLAVIVNGRIIERKVYAPGEHEIRLGANDIADSMLISLEAESSLWKIWAPNLYRISDLYITFTSYFSESSQFKFYVGEEYKTTRFAKIDLVLTENIGTLNVELNGRSVWSSPLANAQSITLDPADLRIGDNTIRFYASEGGKFRGRGSIIMVFLVENPQTFNQTGTITAVQTLAGDY